MSEELCAYCDIPATTRDHVPSKKLFTPPLPENLITVPVCERCNNGASNDDEVFRNELSIMAGSFGESAKAAERLQPTMRGIRRNKATLARLVTQAQLVERYAPSGLYLRHGYAVPVVPGLQQRVITRIVRGLYWHHFETRFAPDAQITLVFIDKGKPHWQEALNTFQRLQLRHVVIGDGGTFQYLYGRANDDPAFSVWLLIFFKRTASESFLRTPATTRVSDRCPCFGNAFSLRRFWIPGIALKNEGFSERRGGSDRAATERIRPTFQSGGYAFA
jgi:hypothetical protein